VTCSWASSLLLLVVCCWSSMTRASCVGFLSQRCPSRLPSVLAAGPCAGPGTAERESACQSALDQGEQQGDERHPGRAALLVGAVGGKGGAAPSRSDAGGALCETRSHSTSEHIGLEVG
jgi:hypothetical protein